MLVWFFRGSYMNNCCCWNPGFWTPISVKWCGGGTITSAGIFSSLSLRFKIRILSLCGYIVSGNELRLKVTKYWNREDRNHKLETGIGSFSRRFFWDITSTVTVTLFWIYHVWTTKIVFGKTWRKHWWRDNWVCRSSSGYHRHISVITHSFISFLNICFKVVSQYCGQYLLKIGLYQRKMVQYPERFFHHCLEPRPPGKIPAVPVFHQLHIFFYSDDCWQIWVS